MRYEKNCGGEQMTVLFHVDDLNVSKKRQGYQKRNKIP